MSSRGQITQFTQGGNLTTNVGFNNKGLLQSHTTTSSSATLVNWEYGYWGNGNLQYRWDKGNGQKEEFVYDDKNNQLTSWDIHNATATDSTRTGGGAMKYQPFGNIVTKQCNTYLSSTGPVVFNYGESENNAKAHAVSSFYGIPIDEKPHTISYTNFNKLETMTQTTAAGGIDKEIEISYGIDNQRRMTAFKESDGTVNLTRYYFDDYEEEVNKAGQSRKTYYISGLNGLTALYIDDAINKNDTGMFHAHTDQLGSLIALSKNNVIIEKYAYDPWGNRRNPTDWSLADMRTTRKTSRGYTLHEHLDGFGVINMNGRVYDPMLSRFLSPDPFIQAPGLAISHNRYAYCMNNPFMYTDPTGEFWQIIAAAAAWWVLNTTATAVNNDMNWWEAAKQTPIVFSSNINLPQKSNKDINIDSYRPIAMPDFEKFDYELYPYEMDLRLPLGGVGAGGFGGGGLTGMGGSGGNSYGASTPLTSLSGGMSELGGNRGQYNGIDNTLGMLSFVSTVASSSGKSLANYSGISRFGSNLKLYLPTVKNRVFNGNQFVKTFSLAKAGRSVVRYAGPIGHVINTAQLVNGAYQDNWGFGRNFVGAAGSVFGGMGGSYFGMRMGAVGGGLVGGIAGEGVGAIPGGIVGGAFGGVAGGYYGSKYGEIGALYLYDNYYQK